MTAPEVSPAVKRGAAAILNLIFPSREEQARAALAAGLDVEELASGPLYDHWPLGADYECKCGVVTGDPAAFTRHQATALRASILGSDA